MKKLTRNLKVELSDDEKLNLMRQMVEITAERSEAEGKLASVSAEYKGTIKSKNAEHDRIAQLVHQGWDYREVEVEEQRDERTKEIVVYRVDTWAEVHRRNMSPEERQLSLKFDGPGDPLSEGTPEDSAKNAKAFLERKGKDDGIDPIDPEWTPDEATEPESVGEIEAGGEQFHKKAITETKINFPVELDFGAAIRVAKDDGDCYHYGYRIASTKPKAAYALPVYVESVSYTDYPAMLESAAKAMIHRLTSDKKFLTMGNERTKAIVEVIEAFFEFSEPAQASAVAGD